MNFARVTTSSFRYRRLPNPLARILPLASGGMAFFTVILGLVLAFAPSQELRTDAIAPLIVAVSCLLLNFGIVIFVMRRPAFEISHDGVFWPPRRRLAWDAIREIKMVDGPLGQTIVVVPNDAAAFLADITSANINTSYQKLLARYGGIPVPRDLNVANDELLKLLHERRP